MPKQSNRNVRHLRPRAPRETSVPTSEFGRLAKQLTELRSADEILGEAETLSRRAGGESCHETLFEHLREELMIREFSLRQHMAWVEPESIEDALALSVLLCETADVFVTQYVDERFEGSIEGSDSSELIPIDEREQWHYRCDKPMMWSMFRNLIRCLEKHAKTRATGWETWEEGAAQPFSTKLAVALEAAKRVKASATAANDVAA
jgi:hypothetical protein